jgi:hypothetical protein
MADVSVIARRGQVTITYASPKVFRFAASLPTFHKFLADNSLIFEATRHSVEAYDAAFPDMPIQDMDGTIARLRATTTPISKHEWQAPLNPKNPLPFNHQREAVDIALSRPYFAFFDDMGTAKSSTITYIIAEFAARKKIDRALIIPTKRGRPQFMNEELPRWMSPSIKYMVGEMPPTAKKREMKFPGEAIMIGFATPGAFQSKKQTAEIKKFVTGGQRQGRCLLAIDESQNFKGWNTNRSNNLLGMLDETVECIVGKYLFSGEPEPHGLEDLLAQFHILDPNIIGHSTMDSFQKQYCVMGGYQFSEIVDYRNMEELTGRIAPHCRYIKITDVQDMPEQIYETKTFEVPNVCVDAYNQVKRELVIEIEMALKSGDREFIRRTCANAASKFTVLAQISNGFFYSDLMEGEEEGRTIVPLSTERAEFVLEELVSKHQKTIVFARFHQDLQIIGEIAKKMNIHGVEFSGRISEKQAEINKQMFQSGHPGSPSLFYATTASGGESLNLQMARKTIYYSNSYNWGHRRQSERRTWRTGQEGTCFYDDVVGMPIDRLIMRNLDKKENLADQFRFATAMAQLVEEI